MNKTILEAEGLAHECKTITDEIGLPDLRYNPVTRGEIKRAIVAHSRFLTKEEVLASRKVGDRTRENPKGFGFLFGFVKAYIISICIFATINIVYNSEKWPIDKRKSFTFSYVEKGSNYLIKEFPNKKNYEDAKDKVTDI